MSLAHSQTNLAKEPCNSSKIRHDPLYPRSSDYLQLTQEKKIPTDISCIMNKCLSHTHEGVVAKQTKHKLVFQPTTKHSCNKRKRLTVSTHYRLVVLV